MPTKDTGLAAIARSTPKSSKPQQPERKTAEAKPLLELEGRCQKTSLSLDIGLRTCVDDTVHVLTRRMRALGGGRVTFSKILAIAFIAFHELPIDAQMELVRKHD